ncbi:Mei4-dependent protein 1 [Dissostichus eleginoides]|uniref:Mei4-dependent protein 1 n=1 Tax=Dissostichus eleginoides TaxID=100907 RepID=A0AAD9B189_DISEL|nr:Mei4-dependent protein 1 [Dissostichus eleginoides]
MMTVKEKQLAEESAAAAKESVMVKKVNEEESGIVPVLSGSMREIACVSVGDFEEGGRWVDDSIDLQQLSVVCPCLGGVGLEPRGLLKGGDVREVERRPGGL